MCRKFGDQPQHKQGIDGVDDRRTIEIADDYGSGEVEVHVGQARFPRGRADLGTIQPERHRCPWSTTPRSQGIGLNDES